MKGTVNTGYGVRIDYPEEFSNPCGDLCSNFEAEALAMIAAITKNSKNPQNPQNVILFYDLNLS